MKKSFFTISLIRPCKYVSAYKKLSIYFKQLKKKKNLLCFFKPSPFYILGHIVSPLSVRTSVPSVRPVRLSVRYVTQMVSVRYILKGLLYFIHRYIIIKCRSSSIWVKSTNYFGSYGPFSTLKKIHKHIIIKYRSSSI